MKFEIKTNKNLRRLSIFQDANRYSTIAIFNNNIVSIKKYKLNFTMKKKGLIRVVGEDNNGKLYESRYMAYVIPGSHRDCDGDISGPYIKY